MSPRRVHIVGIGGIGLSAIARVLLASGDIVSGSDASRSPITDELQRLGARIAIGHRAENVGNADIVLVTSAASLENPEVRESQRLGIRIVKRYDFFPELTQGKKTIAIAGTHGKTTTTGMIAAVLLKGGMDPSVVVGGMIPEVGGNGRAGRGDYFVIEADEYDRAFLGLRPTIAVVTSIEMDHPDIYRNVDDVAAAFDKFMHLVPPDGLIVGCGDHERVDRETSGIHHVRVMRYGLGRDNEWRADNVKPTARGSEFSVWHDGKSLGTFTLQIPGRHNALNALAALAVADAVRVDLASARDTLADFKGAARRFQIKGEIGGVTIVDDYAHHPSEIRATLAAARQRFPGRRIWAVFQPHTYSRTLALLDDFAQAFSDADRVIVADIYAARETESLGTSSLDLVERMSHSKVEYISHLEEIANYLQSVLQPGDVLITLGAGDIYKVGELVQTR